MGILFLACVYLISGHAGRLVASQKTAAAAKSRKQLVVCIDSGHGGSDPGKVGVDGTLEKDINLQIAERLKTYLEASDVKVVMTRESDQGLYSEKDSNKKNADMKNRVNLINESNPDVAVSIHQNSYHEEPISGGQVFYYKDSEKGKRLAQILQKRFDFVLGEKNTRQARPNGNYYLLMHVRHPIVIVECGFLSNAAESKALESEEYQSRLAWTLHMGIMEYLNTRQENRSEK
ncbi:MAG: N-acetylmuramoyl-L-alanine amidase [Clostridiales bacterium]|nr:N-acetylmuramoyl-L-alanine amidase [Clostridiales bacterium]